MLQHTVNNHQVVVQPNIASICHADIRYYTGQRRKEALEKTLPMALFHEGIRTVIKFDGLSFHHDERVVIVPNIPARRLRDSMEDNLSSGKRGVLDNYLPESVFLGSGYDGIAQQYLVLPPENVVSIPDNVPDEIAVLAELTSVSLHAIRNVSGCLADGKVAV